MVDDTARIRSLSTNHGRVDADLDLSFVRVFDIFSTFSENVQIFAALKDFVSQLLEENWDHLFIVGIPFLPVRVVEDFFDVVFLHACVLVNEEFSEWVLQSTVIDPFLEDFQEGACSFF